MVLIAPLVGTSPDVHPRDSPTACPGRYPSSFERTASRRRALIVTRGWSVRLRGSASVGVIELKRPPGDTCDFQDGDGRPRRAARRRTAAVHPLGSRSAKAWDPEGRHHPEERLRDFGASWRPCRFSLRAGRGCRSHRRALGPARKRVEGRQLRDLDDRPRSRAGRAQGGRGRVSHADIHRRSRDRDPGCAQCRRHRESAHNELWHSGGTG